MDGGEIGGGAEAVASGDWRRLVTAGDAGEVRGRAAGGGVDADEAGGTKQWRLASGERRLPSPADSTGLGGVAGSPK